MRLIKITPGAGEGYDCQNCLRDTSLVWALSEAGHTVDPVTLYLPPVADRPEEHPDAPIFYGGINVYLQQKTRVFRKTPRLVDRLFDWPALLRWAGRQSEMTTPEELAETTMSVLRGAEGHQRKELDRLVGYLRERPRPEVVCLSNVLLAGLAAPIKQALGVPVVCLLQDEDAFLDDLGGELAEQAWRLAADKAQDLDGTIAASDYFADRMQQRLGLAARPRVVHNGIHPEGYRPSPIPLEPPIIGWHAKLLPHGGLDLLVEAWARVRERTGLPIRLSIAPIRGPVDAAYAAQVRDRVAALGLADQAVTLAGTDREDRIGFFESLTVLAVPTARAEAFGRHVLEALAAGVPVALPAHGGFVELVERTGGGRLFTPGDVEALADTLAGLLADPEALRATGQAGRRAVAAHYTLTSAAELFVSALQQIIDGASA